MAGSGPGAYRLENRSPGLDLTPATLRSVAGEAATDRTYDLRTTPPNSAGGGDRTRTRVTPQVILSPLRLPIPPPRPGLPDVSVLAATIAGSFDEVNAPPSIAGQSAPPVEQLTKRSPSDLVAPTRGEATGLAPSGEGMDIGATSEQ